MARTTVAARTWRSAATVLLVSVIHLGGVPAAAERPRPALVVEIVNYAVVPHDELSRARDAVESILGAAGVEVLWTMARVPPDARGSAGDVAGSARRVTILLVNVEPASGGTTIGVEGCRLGLALTSRSTAYVFYNRILHRAGERPVDLALVLGRVIAHEIGHLLLPPGRHAQFGIMRGTIDFGNGNPDRFTKEEVQRIGAVLRRSVENDK